MTRDIFEKKIKPILTYIGMIGAIILSVAYVLVALVLIKGFKAEKLLKTTVFALVSAGVGFVIMQFLKIQGITFARNIDENRKILSIYYSTKLKDEKLHSIEYYWITSVIKDIAVRSITLILTSIGLVYIVIEGNDNWNLLLLAIVNLLMFICFGLLALSNAYDFYNDKHMAFVKNKLKDNGVKYD